jgi:hypothetical protein
MGENAERTRRKFAIGQKRDPHGNGDDDLQRNEFVLRKARPIKEAVSDCRGLKFLKANRRELAAYPENPKEHCCKRMQVQVEYGCDVHQSQSECPDALITCRAKFDDYGIRVHDGGSSSITIRVVRTRTRQNDLGS